VLSGIVVVCCQVVLCIVRYGLFCHVLLCIVR